MINRVEGTKGVSPSNDSPKNSGNMAAKMNQLFQGSLAEAVTIPEEGTSPDASRMAKLGLADQTPSKAKAEVLVYMVKGFLER